MIGTGGVTRVCNATLRQNRAQAIVDAGSGGPMFDLRLLICLFLTGLVACTPIGPPPQKGIGFTGIGSEPY
ncbi:hypothetical protein A3721_05975 [Sulfitobacter sp. HI0023]|nr:hypothetical protein A3721_05975 [Sulfitobacter sp. HI0023]